MWAKLEVPAARKVGRFAAFRPTGAFPHLATDAAGLFAAGTSGTDNPKKKGYDGRSQGCPATRHGGILDRVAFLV